MEATINIIAPVFGLIFCGYLLAKTPLIDRRGVDGLNNFVFFVAIPCLLFRAMAQGISLEKIGLGIVFLYFGTCLVLFALCMILARIWFGRPLVEQAIFAMCAVYSNTVMIGIPVIYMMFGNDGLVVLTLLIAFHSAIFITLTTILVEIGRQHGGGAVGILTGAANGLIRNPVILSVTFGAVWGYFAIPIPTMAGRFIDLLAGAAPACALFTMGAALSEYKLGGDARESAAIIAIKLVVLPLIMWVLAEHIFGLSPMHVAIATIIAAMPLGINVYVLAQKYDIYVARSASATFLSTGLAVFSVTFVIALLTGN